MSDEFDDLLKQQPADDMSDLLKPPPDPLAASRRAQAAMPYAASGFARPLRQALAKVGIANPPEPLPTDPVLRAASRAGTGAFDIGATSLLPTGIISAPLAMAGYEAATAPPGEEWEAAKRGAIAGGVGSVVGRLAGGAVRPTEDAQVLLARGIQPTPGQAQGGFLNNLEQSLTSLPIVGHAVSAARRRAGEEFGRTTLGATGVPPARLAGLEPSAALDAAQRHVDDLYNAVVPQLAPSTQGARAIQRTLGTLSNDPLLSPQQAAAVTAWVNTRLGNYGRLSGQELKELDSQLGYLSRTYSRSPNPGDHPLGDAFASIQDGLREGFRASLPPDLQQTLDAANRGYRELLALERAASTNPMENITPRGLQRALAQRDRRMITRLSGPQAELAESGARVLGSTLPTSGTSERLLSAGAMGAAAANPVLALAAIPAYGAARLATSRPVSQFLTGQLPGQQDLSQMIVDVLRGYGGRKQD